MFLLLIQYTLCALYHLYYILYKYATFHYSVFCFLFDKSCFLSYDGIVADFSPMITDRYGINMKINWKSLYQKEHFVKRLITVIVAVIVMGFALSWLVLVDMGTDPCTLMNLTISSRLGISLGNWQALFNSILFIIVIWKGREHIGFGTLANMFLVGYSLDFFSWLWRQTGVDTYFASNVVRYAVFLPALIIFIIAAAVYMDVELGTSPYDAIPFIISKYVPKIPFRIMRIGYDFLVIFIAWIFGGHVQIVTILMALLLGPVIAYIGKLLQKYI